MILHWLKRHVLLVKALQFLPFHQTLRCVLIYNTILEQTFKIISVSCVLHVKNLKVSIKKKILILKTKGMVLTQNLFVL